MFFVPTTLGDPQRRWDTHHRVRSTEAFDLRGVPVDRYTMGYLYQAVPYFHVAVPGLQTGPAAVVTQTDGVVPTSRDEGWPVDSRCRQCGAFHPQ